MKGLKLLTSIALCAAMLVGCSSNSSSDTKTLRFAAEQDIMTMDSSLATDPTSMNALHATNEGLMGINAEGKTDYMLAKSYKLSDDQKTYTFTLRDGLKWTDSKGNTYDLKASDFVFAWRRGLQGEYNYIIGSDGAAIKNADAIIEKGGDATDADYKTLGVTAKDDKTLVVELERPCSYFMDIMTFSVFYPQCEEFVNKTGDKYATTIDNMVSCGAFIATKWTKSSKMTFEKNDNYFNADEVKIDGIEMFLVQDPKTAATNFESDKVDYAMINATLVDKYKSEKEFIQFQQGYVYYMNINHQKSYLANKNIRAAISYAVNREDFTKNVLKDGSSPIGGMVGKTLCYNPKTNKDFRDDSGSYTAYDLTKAQEYLNQGLKELNVSSLSIEILYGTDESPENTVATYLQGSLSKLNGLNITVKATTRQGRISLQTNGNYDIALQHWGPDYSDPSTYLNLGLTGNSTNRGKYSNAQFDAVMKSSQTESDSLKRYNLLLQAEKILCEDYAFIPMFQKGGSALQKTNVKGIIYKMCIGSPYTFTYVTIE